MALPSLICLPTVFFCDFHFRTNDEGDMELEKVIESDIDDEKSVEMMKKVAQLNPYLFDGKWSI